MCYIVSVVEVAVLGSKRRKVSDITEMDLVAGAVQRVVTSFTYVWLSFMQPSSVHVASYHFV